MPDVTATDAFSLLAAEAIDRCQVLAGFTSEPGWTTRTFLSEPMHRVHAEVSGWMTHAGMTVTVDAAGNLRGVYAGLRESARTLYIGSHLDTVPHAGRFDGILGVVAGLALVEQLGGRRLPFAIEVVGFSDEEGVRFGVPFIGSRAFVGTLDDELLARRDAAGVTVSQAISSFGIASSSIDAARAAGDALGWIELHIEQGPVLDTLDLPLAVVDAIAGQSRLDLTFTGAANHAGTTPMANRRDALAGAAEWVVAVEAHAKASPGLVATVGRVDAEPAATNIVAGRCRASLDIRHADDERRSAAREALVGTARAIAARRHLDLAVEIRLDQPAAPMDPGLTSRLSRVVRQLGYQAHHMASGAGHDAMIVAQRMPAAMLFVRSPGGVSHHPDEAVLERDVAGALRVLGALVDDLAAACSSEAAGG